MYDIEQDKTGSVDSNGKGEVTVSPVDSVIMSMFERFLAAIGRVVIRCMVYWFGPGVNDIDPKEK